MRSLGILYSVFLNNHVDKGDKVATSTDVELKKSPGLSSRKIKPLTKSAFKRDLATFVFDLGIVGFTWQGIIANNHTQGPSE